MRGNIAQLMQQAQKMQENLQKAQEEIAKIEVTGSAGGGMVSVTLTGAKECRKVRIDPWLASDPEMLEDLIAAARGVGAAEEVIEAHLVERCGRRVRRDVPTDADAGALGAMHHDGRVPADEFADAALEGLIAGEPRLHLG